MAYSNEQYKAAGQWILANIGNPAAVKAKAKELGLSNADILKAAQTVNSGVTLADIEKYLGPLTTTAPNTTVSAPQDSSSTDQYRAAGQYILANLGDPALIATRAKEFGLTEEELLKAAKSIGYDNITIADIQGYLSKGNAAIQAQAAAEAEIQRQAAANKDRFSTDQYKAAGDWISKNFGDPKAIAAKAKELGLTDEELLKAAQTQNKNITLADVQGYLAKANAPAGEYKSTVEGGKGVDFIGSSGLKEFYGPYVADYLSRASALLGLRDNPNYKPIKFGAESAGGTYGGETAKTLADLQTQRENMMGMGASKTPAYQPYNFSFAPDTKPAAQGGIMSLIEGYDAGGTVGTTFTKPTEGFTSNTFSSGYTAPTAYNAGTISSNYTQPTNMYNAGTIASTYTAPEKYQTTTFSSDVFDPTQRDKYMSTFMSGVTDPQIREAKRQAQLASQAQAAKFSQAGAFGGSGSILAEQAIGRNLATQIGDIYGAGQQKAFENAQQQFERDQQRKLEASKATEQSKQFGAGLAARAAEIAATLGLDADKATELAKQEASRQRLSSAQTSAQLGLQAQTAQEAAKQEAGRQALTSAEAAARFGLDASKLTEQSKQFGANYNLQAAQSEAQYQQLARDLQQRAEEAQARGDQFGANLALQQLQEAQRTSEATRAFEYQQARDTYLDPFRELGYANQFLAGLPISASATGISPTTEAIISALGLNTLLNPTTKASDRRLKTNINLIGMFDDGLKVYSYRYKSGGPVQIGVMADEVAVLRPQAYIKGGAGGGFDAVDYSKL